MYQRSAGSYRFAKLKITYSSFVPPFAPAEKNMSYLYDQLVKEWSRWLPENTTETIRRGGFYSVLVKPGFRIISVNGNYCSRNNFWLLLNSTDPVGQLAWLVDELDAAEAKDEKVHIIGHVPPGQPDCLKVWSRNYNDIVSRWARWFHLVAVFILSLTPRADCASLFIDVF